MNKIVYLFLLMLFSGSLFASGANLTCNNFGHFDLFIDVEPPGSDGAKLEIDSDGQFPAEAVTGKTIVPADFGDFAGGPHKTDDPGWVIRAGDFLGGELLWFRGMGSLKFWPHPENVADGDDHRWLNQMPNEERVRFFGSVPADIVLDGTPEERAYYEEGTIWSESGITGPIEAPIEEAADVASGDAIHTHLDFCLEGGDSNNDGIRDGDCTIPGLGNTGSPTVGAYMIELQLFSNAVASNGSQQKYFDSDPIIVILNNGLSGDECTDAIDALLLTNKAVDDSSPLPASGVLIMSGP